MSTQVVLYSYAVGFVYLFFLVAGTFRKIFFHNQFILLQIYCLESGNPFKISPKNVFLFKY